MTYEEMKDSHEAQIEALLAEDWAELARIFSDVNPDALTNHNRVWGNTGDIIESIFTSLPNCHQCLTQIRANVLGDYPHYISKEAREWNEKLGLGGNELIPTVVSDETVFTRAQLEEFSRLQLLANYPSEAMHGGLFES